MISLLWFLTIALIVGRSASYLIIVDEHTQPGTIIFNASVYKLGSDRHYKINVHRSANFVHHLLKVDAKEGHIALKKKIYCDGIYYPNLFTFYVDSTSARLRTIGYYSMPLRVFVSGKDCNDERRQEMIEREEELEEEYSHRFKRTPDWSWSNLTSYDNFR